MALLAKIEWITISVNVNSDTTENIAKITSMNVLQISVVPIQLNVMTTSMDILVRVYQDLLDATVMMVSRIIF